MRILVAVSILLLVNQAAPAAEIETRRMPVMAQVAHAHTYYWREMYMPLLTSGLYVASTESNAMQNTGPWSLATSASVTVITILKPTMR